MGQNSRRRFIVHRRRILAHRRRILAHRRRIVAHRRRTTPQKKVITHNLASMPRYFHSRVSQSL